MMAIPTITTTIDDDDCNGEGPLRPSRRGWAVVLTDIECSTELSSASAPHGPRRRSGGGGAGRGQTHHRG